jgi:hypothetical protein
MTEMAADDRDGSSGNRDDDRMIEAAAEVTAKTVTVAAVMMAAEGTAMIEVVAAVTAKTAAVTVMMGKAAADGNNGKGSSRWHIGGDTGS